MKRFFAVAAASLMIASTSGADASLQPVFIDAADLEEMRRMAGRLDQLEDAYSAAQKRLTQLSTEIEALRSKLSETQDNQSRKLVDAVTRDDLRKVVDDLQKEREQDKRTILEAIERMGKELSKVPPAQSSNSNRPERRTERKETSTEKPSGSGSELVYTYTVAPGDNLSKIISAYNAALKEQNKMPVTLESIRRANPKINLNNVYPGQEILIPVPADKK